jgi:hypothetical protein
MYCINCGKPLSENDKVCPACNTVVKPTGKTPVQVIVKEPRPSASTLSSVGFKDSFWVVGLQICGYCLISLMLFVSVVGAVSVVFKFAFNSDSSARLLIFFPALFGFVLVAFLTVAGLMIYLQISSDTDKIRYLLDNYKN